MRTQTHQCNLLVKLDPKRKHPVFGDIDGLIFLQHVLNHGALKFYGKIDSRHVCFFNQHTHNFFLQWRCAGYQIKRLRSVLMALHQAPIALCNDSVRANADSGK
jgi:hypothetical protein